MQVISSLKLPLFLFVYCLVIHLLPLVSCFSYQDDYNIHKLNKHSSHQLSPEKIYHITVHGILLWVSMGFLMPVGILIIRISGRERGESTRAKVLFYLHLIFQTLSVLLVTAGAVMSIKNFENLFNNNHQRIGLLLYAAIWIQPVIGFFRPHRGKKGRKLWYFTHWILGTLVSLLGIINIYTGLEAYHKRTLKSTRLWTILFTAQVSFVAFFYLFQDKKDYMQKQGVVLANLEAVSPLHQDNNIIHQSNNNNNQNQNKDNGQLMVPQPCAKRNALRNLFD